MSWAGAASRTCSRHGPRSLAMGRWVLLCKGQQVGAPYVHHTMRLKRILPLLLPEKAMILKNHHDAGTDAEMTRLVYVAALKLAKHTQG